ncbi:hypothetical protein F5882DRAFT_421923 [Hyaloscypha sp. PMI_1271]|nr:hypothetical protein F5882DRAFT_421923 [Hyaloscypha sp. PMI_1271]
MIRCPWPRSVAHHTLFQNDAEASIHFHTHQNAMLESWNGPTKCSWPNCSSTLFKEKYLLNRHLKNIHVTPLRCSVVGCSRLEPFGKESDLKRHVKEIHEALRILCPVESCESNSIGFARKYNLDKHMREEHDNESHIKDAHGDYECALGACGNGLRSCFTVEAARLHLIIVHKMNRNTAYRPIDTPYYQKNRLIDRNAFRYFHLIKKFEDCQACLDSLPGAK